MDYTELLPPLTEAEYAALKRDILESGVQVPILKDPSGAVLDGKHRLRAVKELRTEGHDVNEPPVVIVNETDQKRLLEIALATNLARRHLDRQQLKQLALTLRAEPHCWSQEDIARVLGVGRTTITTWLGDVVKNDNDLDNGWLKLPERRTDSIGRSQPTRKNRRPAKVIVTEPEREPAVLQYLADAGPESITEDTDSTKLIGQAKKFYRERARQDVIEQGRMCEVDTDQVNLLHGDFREVLTQIPDDSIALILTDPPYGKDAVPMYADLARIAARVLSPGASLVAYCGQSVLPDVLNAMAEHLTYWWTICVYQTGPSQRMPGKWIFVEWKPLVWFIKGTKRESLYIRDRIESTPDKSYHDWGQGIEESLYLIQHLTLPGQTVVDPFCGTGTTCLAALQLRRRAVGIDADQDALSIARFRLADYLAKERDNGLIAI